MQMSALHDAWSDVLLAVLRLTTGRRRDLLRHTLQSLLDFSTGALNKASERVAPLRELPLSAARESRQPAASSSTRSSKGDRRTVAALCQHLLAR